MSLDDLTRALREEAAMDPSRKRALRARVLAAPKRRSMRALRWVMPMAAVLAAASVWAAVARDHRERAATAPVAPRGALATSTPVTTVTPNAPVASSPVPIETALTDPIATAPASTHHAVISPTAIAPSGTALARPVDDREHRALRAYREAERLQFDEKDYAHALDAWDRYLPLANGSPLEVDARYQRALCLVRLGRRDEARAALEPFARGELGAYRQGEAQSLLGTLR